jgi:type VI protein secretion system component Hcp
MHLCGLTIRNCLTPYDPVQDSRLIKEDKMLRRIPALAAGVLLAALANPTAAISQIRTAVVQSKPVVSTGFVKLAEVKGESVDAQHKEWIEIESFSWGTSNSGRVAAAPAVPGTPPSSGTLMITKTLDKSTPMLAQRCSGKQNVPEVTVHLPSAGGMMEYVLKDVMISACVQSSGRESLAFNYAKIEMKAVSAPASTR